VVDRKLLPMLIFPLLIAVSGCATVPSDIKGATAPSDIKGEYWTSPDRSKVLLFFPAQGESYYFNNNENRLCYTYKILGKWLLNSDPALLRSTDGHSVVGVLLFSAEELKNYEGNDLVTRASNRITEIYAESAGNFLDNVELEPIPKAGAMKWSATLTLKRAGHSTELQISKIFAEIVPGWVAEITAIGTFDNDRIASHILEVLGTTSEPECYWPLIRKYIPISPPDAR
jgi:hypothetical protein